MLQITNGYHQSSQDVASMCTLINHTEATVKVHYLLGAVLAVTLMHLVIVAVAIMLVITIVAQALINQKTGDGRRPMQHLLKRSQEH